MKLTRAMLAAPLLVLGAGVLAQVASDSGDHGAATERSNEGFQPELIAARDPASAVRYEMHLGNFASARAALLRVEDAEEREGLAHTLDEFELSAICDQAEDLLAQRRGGEALSLLQGARLRLDGATSAMPRAIALEHVADALSRGDPPSDDFLETLKAAEQRSIERNQRRLDWIAEIDAAVAERVEEAEAHAENTKLHLVAEKDADLKREAKSARDKLAQAEDLIERMEFYLDPADFQQRADDFEQRANAIHALLAYVLGTLYYNQESFAAAEREVERELLRNPTDEDLLELRVRILDQWRYHKSD